MKLQKATTHTHPHTNTHSQNVYEESSLYPGLFHSAGIKTVTINAIPHSHISKRPGRKREQNTKTHKHFETRCTVFNREKKTLVK